MKKEFNLSEKMTEFWDNRIYDNANVGSENSDNSVRFKELTEDVKEFIKLLKENFKTKISYYHKQMLYWSNERRRKKMKKKHSLIQIEQFTEMYKRAECLRDSFKDSLKKIDKLAGDDLK